MSDAIRPIVMPKWGLAMQEGMVAKWLVEAGAEIKAGDEILDIETSKIANVFESPVAGPLRRIVVGEGETVPVGALLGVVADASVPDADLDAFVAKFQEEFAAHAAEAGAAAPEPQTIDAGGRRIRYLALGEGEGVPIVFIHGFGGDLNNWQFNQEALAAGRPTYAIDLPGHGGSSKELGAGHVHVGALAGAVVDFMDAKGIAKAHLVGHSLGGAIALDLALNHSDRVASVDRHLLRRPRPGDQHGLHRRLHGGQAQEAAAAGARDAGRRPRDGVARDDRGRAEVQAPGRGRGGAQSDHRRHLRGRPAGAAS